MSEPPEQQADAMEALFAFSKAMNTLSIVDLVAVIDFAVADGLDVLQLHLSMALQAAEIVERRRAQAGSHASRNAQSG